MAKQSKLIQQEIEYVSAGKLPPRDLHSEKFILKACLSGHFSKVSTYIKSPEIFHDSQNKKAFEAILKLYTDGKEITPLEIWRSTRDSSVVDHINAIKEGADTEVLPHSIVQTCLRLVEYHFTRQTIKFCGETLTEMFQDKMDIFEILGRISSHNEMVMSVVGGMKSFNFNKTREDVVKEIAKRHDDDGSNLIKTGIRGFDKEIGGFEPGTLNVFGARPGIGKTAFAIQWAYNLAISQGIPIGFISLEMTSEELVKRLLSLHTGHQQYQFKNGFKGNHSGLDDFIAKSETLNTECIFIEDKVDELTEIKSKMVDMVKNKGVKIVFIDYLQLCKVTGGMIREQQISTISRELKMISKVLEIPVVALAQLSRGVEQREDKRPKLSDLRESGAIEQDADFVAFLYRDEYYYRDNMDVKNVMEILVEKCRNGVAGIAPKLFCDLSINKISDYLGMSPEITERGRKVEF